MCSAGLQGALPRHHRTGSRSPLAHSHPLSLPWSRWTEVGNFIVLYPPCRSQCLPSSHELRPSWLGHMCWPELFGLINTWQGTVEAASQHRPVVTGS